MNGLRHVHRLRLQSGSDSLSAIGLKPGQSKIGRLSACSNFVPGKTPVVLVVVALDQFTVYHLFTTACSGHILAEIRVRAAEIAKHWQRLFCVRSFLFRGHRDLQSRMRWRAVSIDHHEYLETRYSM